MKLSNLMDKEFKLVEKKKIWFIIPACIVALAIVAMIIFGVTMGDPLNLSMDFQGGYTVNVKLSTKLTDSNYDSYKQEITEIIEGLTDENGKSYGLKVAGMQRQGSGTDASIYVKYKAVASDSVMEDEINPAIEEALENSIFKIVPTISQSNGNFTVNYETFPLVDTTFASKVQAIEALATQHGVTVSGIPQFDTDQGSIKEFSFTATGDSEKVAAFGEELKDAVTINDKYSGRADKGDIISATVSGELLTNAILAICLSIVLMLVYIAFRFEVSSGISAIIALLHDIVIMFSFMAICHIEISSTFIAALITILGYSINNTIIVFDRIRENAKSLYYKNSTATFIANQSIKETLVRSINTSLTTLITIAAVAIVSAAFQTFSLTYFALPIIVGLLAGTFSSIFISPSIWAMWKDRKKKERKQVKSEKKSEGTKTALA